MKILSGYLVDTVFKNYYFFGEELLERQAAEKPINPLFAFSGEAIMVLDRNLRVMGFNDLAQRLLRPDFVPGEGAHLDQVFEGPYLAKVSAAIDQSLGRGDGSHGLEARALDAQGAVFDCHYSVNPLIGINHQVIGVILTIMDADYAPLTVQNRLDPLADLPRMPPLSYESLLEHLAEGIFTINTRWRITSFNQAAEKITGYKRNEVLGRYCWDIFRSDVCKGDCPLRTSLESGITRFDQDVRMLDKSGGKLPVLVNTNVVRDRSGGVIGAVETFRLITHLEEHSDRKSVV